ncbi:hypothetical protein QFZ25_002335 [Bacillus atrophaeus]|nr:hypothetical protein [Bacillus atrophaeus]
MAAILMLIGGYAIFIAKNGITVVVTTLKSMALFAAAA